MSQANIPNITPTITLTREEAVNMGIASIALGELGLSHIINAEGEKIQYVLGTLAGVSGPPATIENVLEMNNSVRKTLEAINKQEFMLSNKLETFKEISQIPTYVGPTGSTGATGPAGISLSSLVGYGGAQLDNLSPDSPSNFGIISTDFVEHILFPSPPTPTINVVDENFILNANVKLSPYEMPFSGELRSFTATAYYISTSPPLQPGDEITHFIEFYKTSIGSSIFTRVAGTKYSFTPVLQYGIQPNALLTIDIDTLNIPFNSGDRILIIQYAESNAEFNDTEISISASIGVSYFI